MLRRILVLLVICACIACERPGPAQRTGERLNEIGDNISEGKNPLHKRGPLEKAGKSIDEALDTNKDK